eukprot:3106132-Rhodomonas_salina.1
MGCAVLVRGQSRVSSVAARQSACHVDRLHVRTDWRNGQVWSLPASGTTAGRYVTYDTYDTDAHRGRVSYVSAYLAPLL